MRCLAPFLLIYLLSPVSFLQAGETSIEAALEKARQRAGAPDANLQAKRDKARLDAQQKASADSARKAAEEKKAAEARKAAKEKAGTGAPATPAQPPIPVKRPVKIFTLNDGRQIHAVMVAELEDTYALKDKDGKLEEVKKADVKSIETTE